jgi:hypothetical protein
LYNLHNCEQKLPGGTPLKLKSLLVITLFVVACSFASAQSFGFGSATYGYEYCNYEQLTYNYELTGAYGVTDNLSACDLGYNATGGAFVASAKATGLPVSGSGIIYGDNIYDAESQYYSGYQWTVFSALKCAKINKRTGYPSGKYGWIGLASVPASTCSATTTAGCSARFRALMMARKHAELPLAQSVSSRRNNGSQRLSFPWGHADLQRGPFSCIIWKSSGSARQQLPSRWPNMKRERWQTRSRLANDARPTKATNQETTRLIGGI